MKTHIVNSLTAVRHNDLNEASYSMSLNEKRLVYSALSQIDSRGTSIPDEIKVHATDFADQWGINYDTAYRTLKSAKEELKEREIRTVNLDNGEVWDIRWIDSSAYQDGEGYVILSFSQKIKPYLVDLHKNFTSVRLYEIKRFSSPHTIRFFEEIMQYIEKDENKVSFKTGWWQTSIDNLRSMLRLGDKYETWTDLKRYVIVKAMNEINQKSNYRIWMPKEEIKKKGRVVVSIVLRFEYKKQIDVFK